MTITKLIQYTSFVIGLMIVSACSEIPVNQGRVDTPVVSSAMQKEGWEKRQLLLTQKKVWSLQSKVGLQFNDENWSFGLLWAQKGLNQYVIEIKNPLTGGLVAKLSKKGKVVNLLSDDGKTYRDIDEERLLSRESGVNLPLKGMQYWVRGLTYPHDIVNKLELDGVGRPLVIHQAGWKINYASYLDKASSSKQADAMPRKIIITRDEDQRKVTLKIIIKKWQ